jgi:hypothetical protein
MKRDTLTTGTATGTATGTVTLKALARKVLQRDNHRDSTTVPLSHALGTGTAGHFDDDFEERAAVIEYDGGYPRLVAERMATKHD